MSCLSASTFTVLNDRHGSHAERFCHKCLSASTFTVLKAEAEEYLKCDLRSQMPIGKYIFCTSKVSVPETLDESQMPIGKYIYCTQNP